MRSLGNFLLGLTVLLVAADFLYHKHGHFSFEEWPGFHALLGLLAGAAAVGIARGLGPVLRRPEDYYGEKGDEDE